MIYLYCIEPEDLLQGSKQPATEPKHKPHKMRPQEGRNISQFKCFYSENLEVIILVPGSQT
jgi:hypothetical protein